MSTDTGVANETVAIDQSNTNGAAAEATASEPVNEQQQQQQQTTEGSTSNGIHSNGNNLTSEYSHQQDEKETFNQQTNYEENPPAATYHKNDLEPESFRKVFIGGLSYKTDDQAFRDYFSKFGEIVDCIIMRDREGRSRGFGFVTYVSSLMVDKLMRERPHNLDSREIEPKRAVPREESGKPASSLSAKKLFVGGIREGAINEKDLQDYFSKYGNIIDAVIMKTSEGKFRGFGFVEFDDYDPVDKIVLEKNHTIKGNPVNVEKALPKEQTNRARMAQTGGYGNSSGGGIRGPPPRMNNGGGSSGGWGPMGSESGYGGGNAGGGGGSGGYRPSSGGYGSAADYGSRPAPPYTGGYSSDMTSGSGMMSYGSGGGGGGSSGPMSRGGYGMASSGPSGYDDGFGAFGQPSGYSFGQNYASTGGGGPMRRGGPGMGRGGGGGGGAPYSRGGGNPGRGGYRGRN